MLTSECVRATMQERRSVAGLGMNIQRLTGADIKSRHWDAFYEFYMNTTGDRNSTCQKHCALWTMHVALAGI